MFLELHGPLIGLRLSFFVKRRLNRWFRDHSSIFIVFISLRVLNHLFGRLDRGDFEDLLGLLKALGVAIENVTSVLAVGLLESPSECLTDKFRRKLITVILSERVHFSSDSKRLVFVLSVSVLLVSLNKLLLVLHHLVI